MDDDGCAFAWDLARLSPARDLEAGVLHSPAVAIAASEGCRPGEHQEEATSTRASERSSFERIPVGQTVSQSVGAVFNGALPTGDAMVEDPSSASRFSCSPSRTDSRTTSVVEDEWARPQFMCLLMSTPNCVTCSGRQRSCKGDAARQHIHPGSLDALVDAKSVAAVGAPEISLQMGHIDSVSLEQSCRYERQLRRGEESRPRQSHAG